ncbi:MAG TPA: FAD-dependent oxidoreductase [Bryobacteraceae bacterium]|nr:FAD-dependent oxidoreductase [Bryobacteraceae bacterium]
MSEAATATFASSQRIPAILYPRARRQLQECLRIAGENSIPVYPISTGKNWGYGSKVPASTGCVLIDLSRMNQILEFDENLAYVTIEPGVTQQQLWDYLRSRGSKLWIDATGSSPDSSLIGNTIERGFGHTPYGDHASNVCGFEVVLPNGDYIETGFSRFPNAAAAPVYRAGLGPSLDGLFLQSNLGVITRMTLWLMPAPEYFQAFFFRCDREDALPALINALRPLRLNGTLRSAVHVGNDYKVLAGLQQYPWDATGGSTPLQPDIMRRLRKELKFGAWNGSGGLYGTRAQVGEARRLLKGSLKGVADKLEFLDAARLSFASRMADPFHAIARWDLRRTLELVRPLFGLLQGVPTDQPLASTYWRKRTPPPAKMDPDRDRCGLMWCSPVAPAEGSHAVFLAQSSSSIMLRHGFEPMLSITLNTDRSIICVISLTYDRELPGEDERAQRCCDELETELGARGYIPYRLGIQSMSRMDASGAYGRLLSAIKNYVDPESILAPGRYSVPGINSQLLEKSARGNERL